MLAAGLYPVRQLLVKKLLLGFPLSLRGHHLEEGTAEATDREVEVQSPLSVGASGPTSRARSHRRWRSTPASSRRGRSSPWRTRSCTITAAHRPRRHDPASPVRDRLPGRWPERPSRAGGRHRPHTRLRGPARSTPQRTGARPQRPLPRPPLDRPLCHRPAKNNCAWVRARAGRLLVLFGSLGVVGAVQRHHRDP